MKIISTNSAEPVTFMWCGQEETTGIFKKPVHKPVFLSKDIVIGDEISNRKNHGGYYKACYIFSENHYSYWKELYPDLDWTWGMFGENLTVSDFYEKEVCVGDIYKVGEALVQVSQYREPCYKLGYKFGTQKMLKQFIEYGYAGTYLSVLEEGTVAVNDEFVLVARAKNSLSVDELFRLRFSSKKNDEQLKIAANCKYIAQNERVIFREFLE